MIRKMAILTAATLLTSSCVQQQNMVLGGVRPINNGTIRSTVLAGKNLDLVTGISINPDCTLTGTITYRVLEQPEHGTIKVLDAQRYPNYIAANPRSACNKQKVPAKVVNYTPDDGFTGIDSMKVEQITSQGMDIEKKFIITVK